MYSIILFQEKREYSHSNLVPVYQKTYTFVSMQGLRFLLFPITLIYGGITICRNALYNSRIFKSSSFDMPIICVGNLSMGGTGKTPHTEYLIRLLQDSYQVATLSRGYGRRTTDFILADNESTALTIGDEPLQYFRKFPKIHVAVEKRRVMGVLFIMHKAEDTEVIILDDAFQHRALRAGFNIMLTDFNRPYYDDYILPVGELREMKSGANRANVVIITKCPKDLSVSKMEEMEAKINLPNTSIFFSSIVYNRVYHAYKSSELQDELSTYEILLITGIANPKPIENYLHEKGAKFEAIHFGDHYKFKKKDALIISKKFDTFTGSKKLILTTEKDFSRMLMIPEFEKLPVYCLEIQITLLNSKENFDQKILEYVRTNQRDSEFPEDEDEL